MTIIRIRSWGSAPPVTASMILWKTFDKASKRVYKLFMLFIKMAWDTFEAFYCITLYLFSIDYAKTLALSSYCLVLLHFFHFLYSTVACKVCNTLAHNTGGA